MDKTLKRQIGYQKPKAVVVKPVPHKGAVKFQNGVLQTTNKKAIKLLSNHPQNAALPERLEQSKKVAQWIATHPEFKWSAMCKKLKIDKGNFQRSLKANPPNIKQEYITKIETFLKQYGYN
jgi:hypothetical protein